MRKILIGTPSYDGRLDVWYVNSMTDTIRLMQGRGIHIQPIYVSYDALVQRARNDLIQMAIKGKYECLIFIDSDMEWNPDWILELINRKEDVVGGTARKKTDEAEVYVAKTSDTTVHINGLIKCEGLGTGFVKLSMKALKAIWDVSKPYNNDGRDCRMCCNVEVIDGELYSEDTALFRKLNDQGFICWLDPKMTCAHTGNKKYVGNMEDWLKRTGKLKKAKVGKKQIGVKVI